MNVIARLTEKQLSALWCAVENDAVVARAEYVGMAKAYRFALEIIRADRRSRR